MYGRARPPAAATPKAPPNTERRLIMTKVALPSLLPVALAPASYE
jgi:hypothetical protein